MLSIFRNIFGGIKTDLSKLLADGAVVVDVRSKDEFASGHVKGALNIPLDKLGTKIQQLRKHPHIIVCCRSGARSGMAQGFLQRNGFTNVTNGGSWQNVNGYRK